MTPATVRRQVRLPLRLAGGEVVGAQVYTFDGLVDGLEHLVVALDDPALDRAPAAAAAWTRRTACGPV